MRPSAYRVLAGSYFDGTEHHADGPYSIEVADGVITAIARIAGEPPAEGGDHHAAFVMPGLVEGHCHLFLDGGALDAAERAAYLKSPPDVMMATARKSAGDMWRHGVTLARDAGDGFGVNHRLRAELAARAHAPVIRSPGRGLRRPDRYGAFIARAVATQGDIEAAFDDLGDADDIKIVLTGIIDFKAGSVPGDPQFDGDALAFIVEKARTLGKPTFAHASGAAGIEAAVAAGVGSVEHGYFMTAGALRVMAEKGVAWTPTVSPVHFQWAHPEIAGWDEQARGNLRRILDSHLEYIALAHRLGAPLIAGSDAGSQGARHGAALIAEIRFLLEAGLPAAAALAAATSVPRHLWGAPPADVKPGNRADFIALAASPFKDASALDSVTAVFRAEPFPFGGNQRLDIASTG